MLAIREVAFGSPEYEDSKDLRDKVLRRPIGQTLSEKDVQGEDQQVHLAAYDGDILCGVLILKPLGESEIKFRQMGVIPSRQSKGVGKQLVQFGEALSRIKGFTRVELNARYYALGFYEKLGYAAEGDMFEEVNLPTIKMVKTL